MAPVLRDTRWSTASEIAADVASGETSAATVIDEALARIEKINPALNAFTDVTATRARAQGEGARCRYEKSKPLARGRAVCCEKSCSMSTGLATIAGSKINRDLLAGQTQFAADRTAGSRRRRAGRRAQHGRIRLRLHRRERARRTFAQSARSDAHDRWLIRRLRQRRWRRHGAPRARLRHQWLDPRALLTVRHFRD